MIARVTIIDDNGNPKGVYELKPSSTYEGKIRTKHVFEFEYNELNDGYYKKLNLLRNQGGVKYDD